MRKMLVVVLAGLFAVSFAACAFESSVPDAGKDEDQGDDYPPGPYGTAFGDTAENIQAELVACNADGTGMGRPWALEEYLGSRAILVTVHAGWCQFCKQQARTMESDLRDYFGHGLDVIILLVQDPDGDSNRQVLLDYACEYADDYGLPFPMGIDPDGAASGQFSDALPLNMLLDKDMVIRYKIPGVLPEEGILEGNIEGLLNE